MNRHVKIAFLSEHASPLALRGGEDAGGQNVYVDEVSRNLVQYGYRVDIFTRRDDAQLPEVINWAPGVRIVNLSAGPAHFLAKDELWRYMPNFRDALLRFVEREEVRYDLLHGNFWMSGWVATQLSEALRIPTVQIFHAMGKTKRLHQGSMDTSPSERIAIETQIIHDADRLIAQCPSDFAELTADYQADPHKIVVIPSAVNIEVFHPVEKQDARLYAGVDSDDFVVVYVGRMLPRKDVRNVVRGVAQLIQLCMEQKQEAVAKIKLLLIGGETADADISQTPEIGELQRLVMQLGIEKHVHFVGKRQQDTLCYYYSAGDVAVTTPWYEPFGLTPLEGMACGRPVIGSAVGGITYTLADGETGFLVPPRDPASLAQRLFQLLCEPELRASMGKAARARVEREFTWATVARRTSQLYETVLAEQKKTPSLFLASSQKSHLVEGGD